MNVPLPRSLHALSLMVLAGLGLAVARAATHPTLIIVVDGLRPDYITADVMPNLDAFGKAGVIADAHHAVFPTVTRVNASSIVTGTYPGTHGLMQNIIYLPAASPGPINTADAPGLIAADAAVKGLLTGATLGDLLAAAGKKMLVASSGTSGSAFLLSRTGAAGNMALNTRDFIRPESAQTKVESVIGPGPEGAYPSRAANRWTIDAFLEIGLKDMKADVTVMWLTDPDGTVHKNGIGTPKAVEALRHIDEELGRLLRILDERGVRDQINIFISADHGFSTHGGPFNVGALLTARGLAAGVKVIGGNQIYVESGGDEKVRQIVRVLQATPWVGAIFTRAATPNSRSGFVDGTLSFDAIHYQHARTPAILVDPNWSHAKNEHGFPGNTTAGGVAGHGTSSPYDIRIRLSAAGPDIKRATRSKVPTGNIDLAPTVLHLHGLKPAPSMSGRVLTELLRDGPAVDSVKIEESSHRVSVTHDAAHYEVELKTSRVGATEYVDYTETKRAADAPSSKQKK